jgi:hypothetical protein
MSTETPETPVAATPVTPENVAEMLTSGDNDYHDGNCWHPSLYAQGNVIHIGITAYADDDEGTKLPEVQFRAVVVEGEQTPIVLPAGAGAYIGGEDYLYLRCDRCDGILRLIESGVSLEEQNEALAEHECPEPAQAQTGGASDG